MTTKIEIKPNDQSFVGLKIKDKKWESGDWLLIKCVGTTSFFSVDACGIELIFDLDECNWELCEEKKPERGDVIITEHDKRLGILKNKTSIRIDIENNFKIWRKKLKNNEEGEFNSYHIKYRIPKEQAWVEPGKKYYNKEFYDFKWRWFEVVSWDNNKKMWRGIYINFKDGKQGPIYYSMQDKSMWQEAEPGKAYPVSEEELKSIVQINNRTDKPKKVLKPALIETDYQERKRTILYFYSKEEAEAYCIGNTNILAGYSSKLIQFPAIPNERGEFEVEDV